MVTGWFFSLAKGQHSKRSIFNIRLGEQLSQRQDLELDLTHQPDITTSSTDLAQPQPTYLQTRPTWSTNLPYLPHQLNSWTWPAILTHHSYPLTWFTNVTHLDPLIWLTNSTWHMTQRMTHQPNYYLYHCNIYTNCTKLHHQDGIPTVLIVLTHQSVAQT